MGDDDTPFGTAPRSHREPPPPPSPRIAPPSPMPPPPAPNAPRTRPHPPTYTPPPVHQAGSVEPERDRVEVLGRRLMLGALACFVLLLAFAAYRLLAPEQWDPALEPYVAFVEAERQLEFKRPVDVRWADIAAEIEADFAEMDDAAAADDGQLVDDPWTDAYRLLGLVDPNPGQTADESLTETLVENAGAFYEPWTETIVLPEGQSDIGLSVTIVHELTHALQHQHGMLGGSQFESPDGAAMRTALIEGDAERVAMAYYWSLTEAEQDAYLQAVGYDPDAEFEDSGDAFYEVSFYASYEIGLPLVTSIIEIEGIEGMNDLLRAKDVGTTERLVDPLSEGRTEFQAGENMSLPPGATESVGDLGAVTWFQALAPRVGTARAFDAVVGYDDDAFATFNDGASTCARFTVTFDTPADATEFGEIVSTQVIESVEVSTRAVQVDICEPIGDPSDQRFATVLPLVVGSEVASIHLANGEPQDVARCAGLAQAATISVDGTVDDFGGWDQIVADSAQFLATCQ